MHKFLTQNCLRGPITSRFKAITFYLNLKYVYVAQDFSNYYSTPPEKLFA